ncbi:hypothetical protein QYF36_024623 [Acer negundo]|nr:hypothetical protein QYF36_024623 [Acer negundo]
MEVDPLEHELEDFEEDEDENEETIETIDSSNEWTAHKEAEGWRDKSFPLYERLVNIFGKDGATGQVAGTPQQILDEQSCNEMKELAASVVGHNKYRSDIADEIATMGLELDDELNALTLILDKPSNISTFKSLKGARRQTFAEKLL